MLRDDIRETVAYLQSQTLLRPEIAIVLGSGLGSLAEQITDAVSISYQELPHFNQATAPGHQGRLILGYLAGKPVMCMQGRLHYYEGHSMSAVVYPVRMLAAFGIKQLILSNAAGGINPEFQVGDLMLITDHLNFMGVNPLIGANEADFGPRFHDMSYAYHRGLQKIARQAAKDIGCPLREGVYLACTGPSYETPAEIKMFRLWGAAAVGMSTVPEVIVANHCGLEVLAISCISNMAAGILDQPLTEAEVLETGAKVSTKFAHLVKTIVERL